MEEFLEENSLKFGEEGYYFSTFTASVDYLSEIGENPLENLKGFKNSN